MSYSDRHLVQGDLRAAQVLAEECLQLAEQTQEAGLLLEAHLAVGDTCLWRGEFTRARGALEQSRALYQPQHHTLTPLYGNCNPQVYGLVRLGLPLWSLGYAEQAQKWSHEALQLAQELTHPYSLVLASYWASLLHLVYGEGQVAQACAEATVALCSEHGFSQFLAIGTLQWGQALVAQGQWAEGIVQVREGLEVYAASAAEISMPFYLAWLAEGYRSAGQVEDGLATIAETLRFVEKNDERFYEAEVYRIKGELLLAQENQKSKGKGQKATIGAGNWELGSGPLPSESPNPNAQILEPLSEAEACFQKAIDIAQQQQAKSLELRAVMSLARLWQSHGKTAEARQMLAKIYGWFTEGFETKDLQEARTLIAESSH